MITITGDPAPTDVRTTWRGIRAMAQHEFRLRLRAGRWQWLLLAWFLVLFAFTALMRLAFAASMVDQPGTFMFGALMMFIVALALLVVPALTAQSINGDRERGVLATLQTTLLTPAEIAIGKLVAAWATALAFLGLSIPMILWCMFEGGVPVSRALVSLAVTSLLLGVVCAVAQCLSALFARSTTSAVLSYLLVFAMTVGTVIAFGLATAATQTRETVTERVPVWDNGEPPVTEPDRWETSTYETTVAHTDRVWWLLAPNPFIIVADATPETDRSRVDPNGDEYEQPDPLRSIGDMVRQTRDPDRWSETGLQEHEGGQKALWPYGLAFNLLLGAGALMLTIKRLRAPYRKLPRSVRVA